MKRNHAVFAVRFSSCIALCFFIITLPAMAEVPGRIWTRIRWATNGSIHAYGTCVDADGNIYLTGIASGPVDGQTNSTGSAEDACLIKWNSEGEWQWSRVWGDTNQSDYARAVTVDSNAFVYVTGDTEGSFHGQTNTGGQDCFVTKWSVEGSLEWSRIWGSTNNDIARSIDYSYENDLYIGGSTEGSFGTQTNSGMLDLLLCRFAPDGSSIWIRVWGSPSIDSATDVVCENDANHSIYVCGYYGGSVYGQPAVGMFDHGITKWISNGQHEWTRIWGATNMDGAEGIDILPEQQGVCVAGLTQGTINGKPNLAFGSATIACWDSDGSFVWNDVFGSDDITQGIAVQVSTDETAYVVGVVQGSFGGWTNENGASADNFITVFNGEGTQQWTRIWGSSASEEASDADLFSNRLYTAFTTSSPGLDGQPYSTLFNICAVSCEELNYQPHALSPEINGNRLQHRWAGAWDLAFTAQMQTNPINRNEGWQDTDIPNVRGSEIVILTNEVSAASGLVRVQASTVYIAPTNPPLVPMVLIPAGSFVMGATGIAEPIHTNEISAYYMDQTEISKAQWDVVYSWAQTNSYSILNNAQGKATNHPAHTINWYDCVKWCNARSERDGLTPCYYTDSGHFNVFRSGQFVISNEWVDWEADGYRLPTEAEWEKAAQGGAASRVFPWTGATIAHTQANYYATNTYAYDVSSTQGYHPDYETGGTPYTAPVDSFATNTYGLHNMAGNVFEWCWDWYDAGYYASSPATNPVGPATGTYRVRRGGCWLNQAPYCRVAERNFFLGGPSNGDNTLGFRCVRLAP